MMVIWFIIEQVITVFLFTLVPTNKEESILDDKLLITCSV